MSPIVSKVESVAKLAGTSKLLPAEATGAASLKENVISSELQIKSPEAQLGNTPKLTTPNLKASFYSNFRWEYMVAGIAGGVVSTTVLHPLDLIKIRFQGLLLYIF